MLTYRQGSTVVAEFEGVGVDGDCFEGLAGYPGAGGVGAWSVCVD